MMVRKILAGCFILMTGILGADWKCVVSDYFRKEEFSEAVTYLTERYKNLFDADKPIACILIAYSFSRLGDEKKEREWISDYFEVFLGREVLVNFLAEAANDSVRQYLEMWRRKYPLIMDIFLINRPRTEGIFFRGDLHLGIEINQDAFYRLSSETGIVKGGLLVPGLNVIEIRAANLLGKPGAHIFLLDVKRQDIIIRKEVQVDVEIEPENVLAQIEQKMADYSVSLYIGDQLAASSKVSGVKGASMKVDLPPTEQHYKPFIYRDKAAPGQSAVPILAPLALAAYLIEKLGEKKRMDQSYQVSKTRQLEGFITKRGADRSDRAVKVKISLRTKNLGFS